MTWQKRAWIKISVYVVVMLAIMHLTPISQPARVAMAVLTGVFCIWIWAEEMKRS